MRALNAFVVCLALSLGAQARSADAQIGALKRRAEEEAKKKAEAALKKAMEDSAKKKAAADSVAKAKPTPAPAPAKADSASPTAAPSPSQATPAKADPKIWENYDFVPGSKLLFFTDFSEDRVGNFARGLRYVGGTLEVVERDGVRMLRSTARSVMLIPVGRKLPERFTLEIDILPTSENTGDQLVMEGGRTLTRGDESAEVTWTPKGTFILGGGQDQATSPVAIPESVLQRLLGNVVHVRVLMDSGYFKMYTNERRMYNNPDLRFVRDSVIRVMVSGTEESPTFITAIRLAESETDVMYDALNTSGRWTTHGILFATGQADLQPESRAVLKEIAATLKQHAELKVLIEGHTDNVGSAASNLSLSDARAAAVKTVLVSEYGIDGGRITTKGMGDTKPSAPNATAAGRAQNRRVEVVKQ
jgi:outer membrane protein OmpA-like peptidoglycan-associated protein